MPPEEASLSSTGKPAEGAIEREIAPAMAATQNT